MSLAATIDAMIAAGCTPEQIGKVARAYEAEVDAKAEAKRAARRAGDAERQRRSRASRNAGHGVTACDSALRGVTECDTPSPKERSPTPPKEITPSRPSLRSENIQARDDFDDFWSVVPRKVGKDAALRAYRKIIASGRATAATILAGAIRWRDEARTQDPQFVPHPATWLNRGGWEDEPGQPRAGPLPRPSDGIGRVLHHLRERQNGPRSDNPDPFRKAASHHAGVRSHDEPTDERGGDQWPGPCLDLLAVGADRR